jgi:hypothetical protein
MTGAAATATTTANVTTPAMNEYLHSFRQSNDEKNLAIRSLADRLLTYSMQVLSGSLALHLGDSPSTLIHDLLPVTASRDETRRFFVQISLEKALKHWWKNLLVDEPKITLKHMQPEKPMEDLSQEEQMKIYQMMFDQRQKAMGLPTSEEQVQLVSSFLQPDQTFVSL